jgi:Tol biopolymer transport system component
MNFNPVWLPDGRLSFTSMRKGDFDIYVTDGSGTADEHAVLTGPDDTDPVAWTADGRLVLQGSESDGRYPLKLYDPAHPAAGATRLTDQHVENGGSLSPDDRWLVYQSGAGGRSLLYVRSMAGDASGIPLSRNTGEFPVFLRDGRTLAFLRAGQLMVLPWEDRDGRFEIGSERTIAPLEFGTGWTFGAPYDVTADGRFLALVRAGPTSPPRIRVVVGWDQEVARLGGGDGK